MAPCSGERSALPRDLEEQCARRFSGALAARSHRDVHGTWRRQASALAHVKNESAAPMVTEMVARSAEPGDKRRTTVVPVPRQSAASLYRCEEHPAKNSGGLDRVRRRWSLHGQCAQLLRNRCGKPLYADMQPSSEMMENFKDRRDGQITSLEILSVALGISSFAQWI